MYFQCVFGLLSLTNDLAEAHERAKQVASPCGVWSFRLRSPADVLRPPSSVLGSRTRSSSSMSSLGPSCPTSGASTGSPCLHWFSVRPAQSNASPTLHECPLRPLEASSTATSTRTSRLRSSRRFARVSTALASAKVLSRPFSWLRDFTYLIENIQYMVYVYFLRNRLEISIVKNICN